MICLCSSRPYLGRTKVKAVSRVEGDRSRLDSLPQPEPFPTCPLSIWPGSYAVEVFVSLKQDGPKWPSWLHPVRLPRFWWSLSRWSGTLYYVRTSHHLNLTCNGLCFGLVCMSYSGSWLLSRQEVGAHLARKHPAIEPDHSNVVTSCNQLLPGPEVWLHCYIWNDTLGILPHVENNYLCAYTYIALPYRSSVGDRTFAPRSFAPRSFAPQSFAPRSFGPRSFAPRYFAPRYFAPWPFAPLGLLPPGLLPPGLLPPRAFAPRSFAPWPFAPRSFAPRSFAPRSFAPRSFAP